MSRQKGQNPSLKITLAAVWLIFTVSLAVWWLLFSLDQLDQLNQIHGINDEFARKHRMLMWEGISLILLLTSGGASLIYFIYREKKRYREVKEFFAAFSHDLKTSIASLRLQAESLQEDVEEQKDSSQKRLLARLLKDSVRLELQLENSLFLANVESNQLFMENLSLKKVIEGIKHQWPELNIHLEGEATLVADQRAIESVFKNIIQNSIVHGEAKNLKIQVQPSSSLVKILIQDDGQGFRGEEARLGQMFIRHNTKSGSGVGLYLVRELTRKMNGKIEFLVKAKAGFGAVIELEGRGV